MWQRGTWIAAPTERLLSHVSVSTLACSQENQVILSRSSRTFRSEPAFRSGWGSCPESADHSPQLEVADPARSAGPDPQTGGIIHRTGDRSEAKSQILCVNYERVESRSIVARRFRTAVAGLVARGPIVTRSPSFSHSKPCFSRFFTHS